MLFFTSVHQKFFNVSKRLQVEDFSPLPLECTISVLTFSEIELENENLILNKRTRKMRLLIE